MDTPAQKLSDASHRLAAVCAELQARFPQEVLGGAVDRGQHLLWCRRERIREILRCLQGELGFDFLTDLTAVDYLKLPGGLPAEGRPPERFAVVYHLYALEKKMRLRLKTFVPEHDACLASAASLWPAADWLEREVHDMYGIVFEDHPDLRRILLPLDYDGYPLRKDYPLQGRGYRDNFPPYSDLGS